MFVGFVVVIWIATPLIYYLNVWDSKKFPIISNNVFDKDGNFYNTSKILSEDYQRNETAYKIYGT